MAIDIFNRIMEVKVDLNVIPDFEWDEDTEDKLLAGLDKIGGITETMFHNGSWCMVELDAKNEIEFREEFQQKVSSIDALTRELGIAK